MTTAQPEIKLIAVMGDTGAGKSSFINSVLGRPAAQVSDGSFSCTKQVEKFDHILSDGSIVTLVDTPGFNDYSDEGCKTDGEILTMIAAFLKTQYDAHRKFSGIVFLHAITAGVAGQSTRKNMRLFKQLCGNDQLSNVVVVTTRWDEVCHDEDAINEAEQSETCLMEAEGLLKELNDAGVPFLRTGHFDSADPSVQPPEERYSTPSAVVDSLLGLEPVFLKMQEQMGQGKSIKETDAGMVLEEFKALKLEINERMDTIQRNIDQLNSATGPKAWEDIQKNLIADHFRSLQAKQEQELKDARAEILEHRTKLSTQESSSKELITELKTALEVSRKARTELSTECQTLRTRERQLNDHLNETRREVMALHTDKARLSEELAAARTAVDQSAGLRAQLDEVTKDRDRAKALHFQTELELGRVKMALEESKAELESCKRQLEAQARRQSPPQSPLFSNMQSPLGSSSFLELAPMSVLRGARLSSIMRAEQDQLVKQIDWLVEQGYTSFRLSKGDGDCFYRSVAFAYIEQLLNCPREDLEMEVTCRLSVLSSAKEEIINSGTEAIVVDDAFSQFENLIRNVIIPDSRQRTLTSARLLEIFKTQDSGNNYAIAPTVPNIVLFLRQLTRAQVKNNVHRYESFLTYHESGIHLDAESFCVKYIDPFGVEADHMQVIALCQALELNLDVAYLDGRPTDGVKFEHFRGGLETEKPLATLLYRYGHYDILVKER